MSLREMAEAELRRVESMTDEEYRAERLAFAEEGRREQREKLRLPPILESAPESLSAWSIYAPHEIRTAATRTTRSVKYFAPPPRSRRTGKSPKRMVIGSHCSGGQAPGRLS